MSQTTPVDINSPASTVPTVINSPDRSPSLSLLDLPTLPLGFSMPEPPSPLSLPPPAIARNPWPTLPRQLARPHLPANLPGQSPHAPTTVTLLPGVEPPEPPAQYDLPPSPPRMVQARSPSP